MLFRSTLGALFASLHDLFLAHSPSRDNWTGCCILWYAMEKEPDYVVEPNGDDTPADEHLGKYGAREGAKASEAKDIYGDIQTAEEYGYVSRG